MNIDIQHFENVENKIMTFVILFMWFLNKNREI